MAANVYYYYFIFLESEHILFYDTISEKELVSCSKKYVKISQ